MTKIFIPREMQGIIYTMPTERFVWIYSWRYGLMKCHIVNEEFFNTCEYMTFANFSYIGKGNHFYVRYDKNNNRYVALID